MIKITAFYIKADQNKIMTYVGHSSEHFTFTFNEAKVIVN